MSQNALDLIFVIAIVVEAALILGGLVSGVSALGYILTSSGSTADASYRPLSGQAEPPESGRKKIPSASSSCELLFPP